MKEARNVGAKAAQKLAKQQVGKALAKGAAAVNPLELIREVARVYAEVQKVTETETTKRAEILASAQVELARIAATRDVLMDYLDRSFDERKENFARLFDALDAAREQEDPQATATTLGAIIQLAQTSPFVDLQSVADARKLIEDPTSKIKL